MANECFKTYKDLQKELDDAKITLGTLNEKIIRIVGRTSKSIKESRTEKFKSAHELKRRNGNDRINMRSFQSDTDGRDKNFDNKSIFNRLSSPVTARRIDDDVRPKLTSSIVRELPSRQDIVAAQSTDSQSHARNRRMFGSLLGTLHKFCQEESRLRQKEEKKAKIEKKLEQQELRERESIKKERESLFLNRKRKQLEIKQLELKLSRLKDFETWQNSETYFKSFIRTKTLPRLYYKPKIITKKMELLLNESQRILADELKERRQQLDNELQDIENSLNMNNVDGDDYKDRIGYNTYNNTNINQTNDGRLASSIRSLVSSVRRVKDNVEDIDDQLNKTNEPTLCSSVVIVKKHIKQNNIK